MKRVVTYAILIALGLISPEYARDKKSGEEQAPPLMMHVSLESQAFQVKRKNVSSIDHQHISYAGTTIKPLEYAWVHLGAKSKFSQALEMPEMYVEPVTLYSTVAVELLRNRLYLSGGFQIPLQPSVVDSDNSDYEEAFNRVLNQYHVFGEQNLLILNSISAGIYYLQLFGAFQFKAGVKFIKPNSYELYKGIQNIPAAYLNYHFEINRRQGPVLHLFHSKISVFQAEKDRTRRHRESHVEGPLYQIRYGLRFHTGPAGWETALGTAFKKPDKNRPNLIQERLVLDGENNNIQRFYFDINWVKATRHQSLVQLNCTPTVLYQSLDNLVGYQAEALGHYKFRLKKNLFSKISISALFGTFNESRFIGGGIKLGFTKHRARKVPPSLYPERR